MDEACCVFEKTKEELDLMRICDVVTRIEERLPRMWSEEWDNVGLIIGDPGRKVSKIAVALDATEKTVCEAVHNGCEMLVVHHPAIFRPINRVVPPAPVAQMLSAAIKGDLSVYSSHTNWDSAPEGVNVILAGLLGLSDLSPIMPPHDGSWGMGAVGGLSSSLTLGQLARKAKDVWGLSALLVYGEEDAPVKRVSLCGGAGGGLLPVVIDRGADVYVTADVSYHYLLHAQLAKMNLIVVNHGEMERASLPNLCDLLREVTSLDIGLLGNSNWTPFVI